jgi:hypothetical protein
VAEDRLLRARLSRIGTLLSCVDVLGFVGAEGVFGKRIPGGAIGSSAGTPAKHVVFAVAAASLEL